MIKTYKEMNDKIVDILRRGDEAEQYAAQYIEELQTENAALRERLDKAVELPCEIGTTVFVVKEKNFLWKETHIATGKIKLYLFENNSLLIRIAGSYTTHDWEYTVSSKDYNKTWFTDRTAAEKRLAELGGE